MSVHNAWNRSVIAHHIPKLKRDTYTNRDITHRHTHTDTHTHTLTNTHSQTHTHKHTHILRKQREATAPIHP